MEPIGPRLRTALEQQWMGVAVGFLALFVALGGPAGASSVTAKAGGQITSKQIKDGTIAKKDLSGATIAALRGQTGPQGPAGPAGPQGPPGSADTPAEVLSKLNTVDGAGSGLDADLLDGLSASAYALAANALLDGDPAGGDLSANYPDPQIASGVVGAPEIAANAVGSSELDNGSVDSAAIQSTAINVSHLASGGTFSFPSLNLGSVGANACRGFQIPVSTSVDLNRGEVLVLTPGADALPAGMTIAPLSASTDDALGVLLCNDTAAAVDPPAFLLTVRQIE